ncbi:hypothetical protein ACSHWO_34665 [Streptomyces sp. HUAS TT3]|uniref:hypothetical protein n=1 Tax=Streptomyces sp. HUAS TT3 TaxID=3447510 RepID=UPI003F655608
MLDAELLERIPRGPRNWMNSKNSWPSSGRRCGPNGTKRAIAERVLERVSEQLAGERALAARRLGRWVVGR